MRERSESREARDQGEREGVVINRKTGGVQRRGGVEED